MKTKRGFNYGFDASKCAQCGGKCCTGESGHIFIDAKEAARLSEHLKLSIEEFKTKYLTKVGAKMSLKEKEFEDGFACIFFDEARRNCGIYALRPKQCRTFPFWDYFKNHQKELEEECIGICYLP
ncbi:YkgJ family cysteine cluster protein [Campylobacter sp.]|uniref:YkgJ family cysteine cluster protein n=1 Tax=Campylobacter sp. TaxID=205 RepID=UPI0026DC75E8|nr:YkgJ family cysteine cluster protein [Campylobacter sp.]MDO4673782.1 YkgJ family cysteine cluster protein [Campylobacter sp.]